MHCDVHARGHLRDRMLTQHNQTNLVDLGYAYTQSRLTSDDGGVGGTAIEDRIEVS